MTSNSTTSKKWAYIAASLVAAGVAVSVPEVEAATWNTSGAATVNVNNAGWNNGVGGTGTVNNGIDNFTFGAAGHSLTFSGVASSVTSITTIAGWPGGTVTFSNGGTLATGAITSMGTVNVNGGGVINTGGNIGTGTLSLTSGTLSVTGNINASTSITTSAGTTLTASDLAGTASSTIAGTHNITGAANLGTGYQLNGGTLRTTAAGTTAAGNISLINDSKIDTGSGGLTLSGIISGAAGNDLIKEGLNTLTLTNANTYFGATIINEGTVALTGNGTIANSSVVNLAGGAATFDISGITSSATATIHGLAGVAGTTVNLGTKTLAVGDATSTTFAGKIIGTGNLQKEGAGTLTLSGNNTYTGATIISAGTLALSGTGSITTSSRVELDASGAGLDISATTAGATVNKLTGVAGSKVVLGGQTLTVNNAIATDDTIFGGVISGTGNLVKDGAGKLTLTGANTYNGNTTINAGTLYIANDGSLGSGSYGGVITIAGTSVLHMNQAADQTLSGKITGAGSLTKDGTKTLTLTSANNTYTGVTTVTGGTLELTGVGSIAGSSKLDLSGGAEFDISGTTAGATVKALSGVAGTHVTLGTHTLTVGDATSTTFAGVVAGAGGSIIKEGAGKLTLAGPNTYTGTTTVNAGILELSNVNAYKGATTIGAGATLELTGAGDISQSSGVTLGNGATFDIDNLTGIGTTIQGLNSTFATSVVALGTKNLIIDCDTADSSYDGKFTGDGDLIKSGSKTLTLNNLAPYAGSGAISITDGTLEIAGALGTLAGTEYTYTGNIANDGTLKMNQTVNQTLSGTISGIGSLEKSGPGMLTLSSPVANTYSGGTTVLGGILSISNDNHLGPVPATALAGKDNVKLLDSGMLLVTEDVTLHANRGVELGAGGGTIAAVGTVGTPATYKKLTVEGVIIL